MSRELQTIFKCDMKGCSRFDRAGGDLTRSMLSKWRQVIVSGNDTEPGISADVCPECGEQSLNWIMENTEPPENEND